MAAKKHRLTYWVVNSLYDSPCYNIRAKTKKALLQDMEEMGVQPRHYGPPTKVTVEYRDAFDLLDQCLQAGGAIWEPMSPLPEDA